VLVYPEGEGASYIDSFYVNGSTQTNGVENINGSVGNYHLEILDANIPSYTIIVQQYGGTISSASEGNFDFGNLTNVILVVLVVAIFAVAVVVVLFKRRKNPRSPEISVSPPPPSMMLYI
jgi:ABC-type transport system involved in multi-copper enzyme maturation permease subunit